MIIIAILFLLSATTVAIDAPGSYINIGGSIHAEQYDYPEHIAPNPLATYEIGYTRGKLTGYVIHTSSVPRVEHGSGLNQIGFKYRIWEGGK